MRIFSRKRATRAQAFDALIARAVSEYESRDFATSLQTYGEAIHKLNLMYAVTGAFARIRHPGSQDQPVLEGFINALHAVLVVNPRLDVTPVVIRTVAHLRDIVAVAGDEAGRYIVAAGRIEMAYKRGGS